MNIIEMISANQVLAKQLSAQQVMDLFAEVRDGEAPSFEEAEKIIELFGVLCWQLENEQQQENCFGLLHDALVRVPQQSKGKLAVKLVKDSVNYPRFVFLAKELFCSIPPSERQKLKFYPLNWTYTDDFTVISSGEYEWRKKHGLPCSLVKKLAHRPISVQDLVCFEISLCMLYETGSEAYIYIP